jgi:hypothetical protein
MKLNRHNIVKCGFFPDNLPSRVFSTVELAEYIKANPAEYTKLEVNLKSKKVEYTPCHLISSYKNDLERRIIAIPHIETYIVLALEIEKNNVEIENKFNQNINSYSNKIQPNTTEGYELKSCFHKNYLDRTVYSTGFKYLLKVDLSKCYENIYTHSLSWAMFGKENAKNELKKTPANRDPYYIKVDEFDKKVRMINNNETKGIPTGPISSRIVSEIILTSIDEILVSKNYHFKRYVDDYNIYFRNEVDAYEFLPQFQNILYEYKLHLNTEKTKLEKYPYQLNRDFTKELRGYDLGNNGYLGYIEKLVELHNEGNKGALKYGLKVLSKRVIPDKEKEVVFSHLINIMLTFPNLSENIHGIFLNNSFTFDSKTVSTVNSVLKHCIKNKYELEMVWLLTIMGCLGMDIEIDNIIDILIYAEPCTTIIALDYIQKNGLYNNASIISEKNDLKQKLLTESIYGDKWLLIYEICRNNWIKGLKNCLLNSPFLKKACQNNIPFYTSPIS